MITIGRPYIEERGQETFLFSKITDEGRNRDYLIWYSVDKKYGEYLCDDNADAYLLLILQWAMKSHQDIKVEAPVSSKLLFNIKNTLQPLYENMLLGSMQVQITAQTYSGAQYGSKAVGCCCSLGVDSFYSFLRHYGDEFPEDYRVTHLTLFNSGQLGFVDLEATEQTFRSTIHSLQPFVEEVGLPLVAIDTNLNEFYLDTGIRIMHNDIDRTISCALAMQKLFGKYVFSSSYSVQNFKISHSEEAYMESSITPLLGSDNLEVILSDPMSTRVDKTRYITQFPITTKYLDVCWASQMANGACKDRGKDLLEVKKNTNCGRCGKCLRTMLTLDLLGQLQRYEGQFDMEYYESYKDKYIEKVQLNENKNVFCFEIADLLKEKNYRIPTRVKCKMGYKMFVGKLHQVLRIPSKIKRLFNG